MEMMFLFGGSAEFAEKRHVNLAKHIESSHTRTDPEHHPNPGMAVFECAPDDLVLGHEAGKRWNSANRQCRRQECPESDWQAVPQTAHISHVLLTTHRMNH